eukprot:scaffold1355_cov268-Pinguiococcus_pyrenoidosus.AAC.20
MCDRIATRRRSIASRCERRHGDALDEGLGSESGRGAHQLRTLSSYATSTQLSSTPITRRLHQPTSFCVTLKAPSSNGTKKGKEDVKELLKPAKSAHTRRRNAAMTFSPSVTVWHSVSAVLQRT